MRNLKKVLALALATVMLLGMMAMASAADYADEAAIAAKYDVAVDVMNAVGVFEGDPEGNFNPTNTLTRAEAAKVIAFIGLTKANAGKLTAAAAPFEDVAADHWAAGAIAYAQNMGIVKGMTETTYEPNSTLKGFQFAKMLLVTLGYKATVEGYEGAGWDINVHLDALDAGLLKGLDIDLAANITREEAAQMAFNALQANTVTYANASNIVIGNVSIQNGGTLTPGQTLAEKLYPTLKSEKVDTKFGYSTIEWSYGTPAKVVATGANYEVLATYAGTGATVTKDEVYEAVGALTAAYYVNGADAAATLTVTKAAWNDKTTAAGLGYAGATIEIVKNNGVKEVLVADGQIAKVTKVTDADAAAGTKRTITVAGKTFETEEFAKDDYVLYYLCGDEIAKVVVPETVTGVVTKTDKGTDGAVTKVYFDGTAYPVAGTGTAAPTLGEEYTAYLENGHIELLTTEAPTVTMADYVYVVAFTDATADAFAAAQYQWAQIVTLDGKVEVVKAAIPTGGTGNNPAAGLYKMAESKGLKTFAAIDTTKYTEDAVEAQDVEATAKSIVLDDGKAYLTAASKMLVITFEAGLAEEAKVVALPSAVEFKNTNAVAYYTTTTTTPAAKELALVIADAEDLGALALEDLYYVVNKDLGHVYVAESETTYETVAAYNVFTGEKLTVKVANAEAVSGFATATIGDDGEYAFTSEETTEYDYDATTKTGYVAVSNKGVDVYAGMMTIAGTAVEDLTYADAKFVNLTGNSAVTLAKIINKTSTFTGFAYVTEGKVTAIFAQAATLVE